MWNCSFQSDLKSTNLPSPQYDGHVFGIRMLLPRQHLWILDRQIPQLALWLSDRLSTQMVECDKYNSTSGGPV